MPIPLAVTDPKAKGLAAMQQAELPTQGPFARLGAHQSWEEGGGAQPGQQQAAAGVDVGGAEGGAAPQQEAMGISTQGLNFWYPGIGGC